MMSDEKYKMLAVCGGGVWGAGVANATSLFSVKFQDHGLEFSEYFDCFAGTSVGAIVAACYAHGLTSFEVNALFEKYLKKIFTKQNFFKRMWPSTPKYTNKYFREVLGEVFGEMTMGELEKPCYIPTWRTNGKDRNKVYSPDEDEKVVDVVLASAAAPTYFPSVMINGEENFDGGLWANNPAMAMVSDELDFWEPEQLKVLTLITGGRKPGGREGSLSLVGAGMYLADRMMTGSVTGIDHYVKKTVPDSFTICPIISDNQDYDLDAVGDVDKIKKIWVDEIHERENELYNFMVTK
jgi:hypothetical protein